MYDDKNQVQTGRVRLASIEFGANAQLCKSLGISRLPSVHMYKAPVGRISSFPCGPNKFPILMEKMERYLSLTDAELLFEKRMNEGGALADEIVTELHKQHKDEGLQKEGGRRNSTSITV